MAVQEEVNYLDDTILSRIEQEHDIEAELLENGKVHVLVSEKKHPMEVEHKIVSISLYDEYGDILEEKFLEEEIVELEQVFDDYGVEEFEIRVKCSKHGVF